MGQRITPAVRITIRFRTLGVTDFYLQTLGKIEMTEVRFKVIERSSVEKVIEVAVMLIERGYKPVAEIMKMPNTGLFTQVMHWEPQYRTPNR